VLSTEGSPAKWSSTLLIDEARNFLALYALFGRAGADVPDSDDGSAVAGVTGASLEAAADLPLPAALLGG
jgi:hypothetical protein